VFAVLLTHAFPVSVAALWRPEQRGHSAQRIARNRYSRPQPHVNVCNIFVENRNTDSTNSHIIACTAISRHQQVLPADLYFSAKLTHFARLLRRRRDTAGFVWASS